MTTTNKLRGQFPERCGTCKNFPGNATKCKDDTLTTRSKVYANDLGKGYCKNYKPIEE